MKLIIYTFLLLSLTCNAQIKDKNLLEKYKLAIKQFDEEHDINDPEFYFLRGGLRQDFNDLKNAIKDYTKSIELKETFKAYYNRGICKMDLGKLSYAIKDFDKALELDPNNAHTYNNKGNCEYFLEHYISAIENYEKSISLNPQNAEAYNNLGISKIKMGVNGGCQDIRKAIELGDLKASENLRRYCPE